MFIELTRLKQVIIKVLGAVLGVVFVVFGVLLFIFPVKNGMIERLSALSGVLFGVLFLKYAFSKARNHQHVSRETKMNIWIQKHDFSSIDISNVQVDEAIKTFENHDWQKELAEYKESDEGKCDPGFGIVAEHAILHVCPINDHTCYANYHYRVTVKLFGIVPFTSEKTHYIDKISIAKVKWLIECHYWGKKDNILKT